MTNPSRYDRGTVAIVIPCFNAGEFLDETVESALAQTYEPIQIVLVDDGSTDPGTLRTIQRWEQHAAVHVLHQANAGLSAARNAGVGACDAEYFLPLDADDLISPTYVQEAVAMMEADPSLGIVYSRAELFGSVEGEWKLPPFTLEGVLTENCIFATSLFRRADWERAGGYDPTMRFGREDHDFILKILSLGRTVHRLDKVHFRYRQHAGSMNRALSAEESRERLIAAYAQLFRNNQTLYAKHAEKFWRGHFAYRDQRNELRMRYRHLERLRESRFGAWALSAKRHLKRLLRR